MDIQYLGNKDFLQLPATAFLASGTIKPDEVLKCFDWAVSTAKEGRCVQTLLDDNRLLIVSVSNSSRQSKATAFERNKYICEIAEQILFVGVTEKSSLYPLYNNYSQKRCTL